VAARQPLVAGNIDTTGTGHGFLNGATALNMRNAAATRADDYRDVTQPKPGQFQLALPTWNLENPSQKNDVLKFAWDPKVDPALDTQTRAVTRDFFKQFMGDLGDPKKSGTNTNVAVPKDLGFDRKVAVNGQDYQAKYDGKALTFTRNGEQVSVPFTPGQARRLHLDNQSFGDMNGQLGLLLRQELEKQAKMKKTG